MSVSNPIDLNVRSQAFLKNFLKFHMKTSDLWAIVNTESTMLASESFSSSSLDQALYGLFGHEFTKILKASTLTGGCQELIVSFPSINYSKRNGFESLYYIEINSFSNDSFYLKAKSPLSTYLTLYDLNVLSQNKNIQKIPIDKFKNMNPVDELMDDEWKIAWLFISGLSYRQIASFLNISRTTVENKMKYAYGKLELLGEENFKYVAEINMWRKYIPYELLKDFLLIIN